MRLLRFVHRYISIPVLLLMLFPLGLNAAQSPIAVTIDGRSVPLTQPPITYQGRVLVPLRGIFENLGASVMYDPSTRTINANRGSQEVSLQIGSRQATINGQAAAMDVPPLLVGGRAMVPLRFVSQALGTQVNWDAFTHTVNILSLTGGTNLPIPNSGYTPPSSSYYYPPGQTYPAYSNPAYGNAYPANVGNYIQRISVAPQSAVPGQAVTVTMYGVPGGAATAVIGGNALAMTETTPGVYTTAYAPTSNLMGQYNDVTVQLRTADGRNQSITDAGALYVQANGSGAVGSIPLTIGSLSNGIRVAQQFDVIGATTPNATVNIRVLSSGGILGSVLGVKQTLVSRTIQADSNGNFTTRIDTGNLPSGSPVTVLVQSQDPNGALSAEQQFQIYRQ